MDRENRDELPPDHQEGLETDYINKLESRLRITQDLARANLKQVKHI